MTTTLGAAVAAQIDRGPSPLPWTWTPPGGPSIQYAAPQRDAVAIGRWTYTGPDGREWHASLGTMPARQRAGGTIGAVPIMAREAWEQAGGDVVPAPALIVPVGEGRRSLIDCHTGEVVATGAARQWLLDVADSHGYRSTDALGRWTTARGGVYAFAPHPVLGVVGYTNEEGHWAVVGDVLAGRDGRGLPVPAAAAEDWRAVGGRVHDGDVWTIPGPCPVAGEAAP